MIRRVHTLGRVAAALVSGLAAVLGSEQDIPAAEARRIVDRAIVASGGAQALSAARVLKWKAHATIHTTRGPLHIEGRWILEPPDRAVVTTWEPGKQDATTRRMLLDGGAGWMERDGRRTPMPATVLSNERDQFYLYSVMRLVPLLDPEVGLKLLDGGRLAITHPRRPDVEASFGDDGRLVRLRTHVSHPADNSDIVQDVTFDGTVTAGGIVWPRSLIIVQDGRAFFDMTISEIAIATGEELSRALQR